MKTMYLKFGLLITFFALVLFIVYFFDLAQYASIEVIQSRIADLGYFAPLGFILLYVVNITLFLPFSIPLDLVAGALFGAFWGTVYVVIGATAGSGIAFSIARILGRPFVESVLENKLKKLERYDEKLQESSFKGVLLFRMIPIFPFNILNLTFGLTGVSLRNFLLGTFLGIIPVSFIYVYFGVTIISASFVNIFTSTLHPPD